MLESLFKPTVIAEYVTFIAALFLLPRRVGVWRLFVLFMLVTIVTETVGFSIAWSGRSGHNRNNHWLFNLYLLIENVFCIWIFLWAEPMKKARRLLWGLLLFYVCFGVGNLLFFQGVWTYNSYTDVLGDVELAIVCCYFFYACLREEELRDLFRYEYFWLANGLLFSALGSVVLYIFIDALYAFARHSHIDVYRYINSGLNFILYGSMIIAFICRNRNTRSSPG